MAHISRFDPILNDLELSDPNRNRVLDADACIHNWYRFVLSFPPHLVRHYLNRFGASSDSLVLDPFAGTGTTLVEAKKQGIPSIGVEANPVVHFAASTKTNWSVDPQTIIAAHDSILEEMLPLIGAVANSEDLNPYADTDLFTLPDESLKLLLRGSLSPIPMHKSLLLREQIEKYPDDISRYLKIAFASMLVQDASNLRFGPEVGVTKPKLDADVLGTWSQRVLRICEDLRLMETNSKINARVIKGDARQIISTLPKHSIDCVITSPPYPNEKDYTRTTRLESVMLGYMSNRDDLRAIKHQLVRSNTRGVYKADSDDLLAEQYPEVCELADRIEARRIELGKTSGFERLYSRVTKLYFGGMAKHLSIMRDCLAPGAMLAYVVGDQASYFRILIRTAPILASIAESLGYEVESIDLFRTRAATATKSQLREEVLVLRWHG